MRGRVRVSIGAACLALAACTARAQDAKTLRAQAETETTQEKQVLLLCKAADAEPKNKDYRKDCNDRKAALITSDRQQLKTALDAADANQVDKAKRYAKYVSVLDPDLHQQAQQLIAKLTAPAAGPAPAPVKADQSGALMNQAQGAFDAGNLAVAKSAAEGVTDSNIKGTATHLLRQIESYSDFVSAGKRQEDAKDYAQAINSYQSAQVINSHVGADDLNGRMQHLHQQIAAAAAPAPTPVQAPPPPAPTVARNQPAPSAAKPPEPSPEEKKKKLFDAYTVAMGRKDLEGAERDLKQMAQLDPRDADAKDKLKNVQDQLLAIINRDPVKLEKTLHDAVAAFYASNFEDAESELNRYIGADSAKKKGLAYFYLGATEQVRALLAPDNKRSSRQTQAKSYFKQARSAGYQPVEKYLSEKILQAWQQAGS